jgi:protein-S-isoprenylcysteine O-methyltransferase Ste14
MPTHRRIALFVVLYGGLGYFLWQNPPAPWTWMQTTGLCLMVPGFLLWLTAHMQLGRSFTLRAEARALVTRGLYSRIRNPIYVFGAIFLAGLVIFIGRPYLLLLFAILIPMQVARARKESRVLEEKFGEEYRRYRAKTWF